MQLHRASKKPDWEHVAPRHRNRWQRLAAATHGIVTPANLISLLGFLLVVAGLLLLLRHRLWEGALLVVAGRLADLADGFVAQRVRTKSPLGEAVDATIDKLGALLALGAFAIADLAPLWVLTAIALLNIVNTTVSLAARRHGTVIHPSAAGKQATAAQWMLLALYIGTSQTTADWVLGAALITLVWSTVATAGYLRHWHTLHTGR